MDIKLNKTDSVNALISVEITKADYEKEVENSLKDLRKNAVISGFRKGMIPPSLLRQMYGKSVIAEEVNKLVSKSLSDYIHDNNLQILGEPLPAEGYEPVDLEKEVDFVFNFEIGLYPKIDVKLTKDDKIPYYLLQVSEEMIDKKIENLKSQYGNYKMVEDIDDKDIVKGIIIELDENGEQKENGVTKEDVLLMPMYIKNENEKTKLLNAKLNSTIIFNPYTAFDGNEVELSSFLSIEKEEVKNYTSDFSFVIKEIKRHEKAELNNELFDKLFEPGTVDSEETFRQKIKEDFKNQFAIESNYKFFLDAMKLLEEKANNMQFPDAFLKRWLLNSDSKRTQESLEEEYPQIIENLKLHLIREHLIEENEITIEENELNEYAKKATLDQFEKYGIDNMPDDYIEKYSQEMLKNKETYKLLGDKIFEDKLITILKEQATLELQEISVDEFQKLINTNQ